MVVAVFVVVINLIVDVAVRGARSADPVQLTWLITPNAGLTFVRRSSGVSRHGRVVRTRPDARRGAPPAADSCARAPGLAGAVVLLILRAGGDLRRASSRPYDPVKQDFRVEREPPSLAHPMGTDEFGRDMLSRVIWGARVSLQAGAMAATIALVVGSSLGMLAAFYGGRADTLIMRSMDVMLAFPYLLLAIGVVAILGPGLLTAMIAIGIVHIPAYARIVRGSVLVVRSREYVEAARALGASDLRVMRQHVLPNVLAPIIVQATLNVGQRDHRHGRAELPGPGHPAADAGLGQHAGVRPQRR